MCGGRGWAEAVGPAGSSQEDGTITGMVDLPLECPLTHDLLVLRQPMAVVMGAWEAENSE